MSGNVAALPKWAQNEIARLEGKLAYANARWADFVERSAPKDEFSDTFVGSRQIESEMGEASALHPLPNGEVVTFRIGELGQERDVEIRVEKNQFDEVRRLKVRLVGGDNLERLGVLSDDATSFTVKVVAR